MMRSGIGRLLIALGILLSGTVVALHAAFPSEKIEWQNFASAYIYEDVADLRVTKSGSSDTLGVGQPLTYTIVVTNAGPDKATGVTITDPLPGNVLLESISSSQGDCSTTNSIINCNLGDLVVNHDAMVSLTVIPTVTGTITNTVYVFGNEVDPILDNNEATAVAEVSAVADLAVTKFGVPDPVSLGSTLTYTVIVTNAGPSNATGVVLTDTLMGVGDFGIVSPSHGACNGVTPLVCDLGDVIVGDSITITFVFTPTMVGTVTNTVEVAGIEFDPDLSNNQTVESTVVTADISDPIADLAVTKVSSLDSVIVGEMFVYTVTVVNDGPDVATSVVLTDTLSGDANFGKISPSQGSCSGITPFICDLGTIANEDYIIITMVVTPTAEGTLTNTVQVSSEEIDPYPNNNLAIAITGVKSMRHQIYLPLVVRSQN